MLTFNLSDENEFRCSACQIPIASFGNGRFVVAGFRSCPRIGFQFFNVFNTEFWHARRIFQFLYFGQIVYTASPPTDVYGKGLSGRMIQVKAELQFLGAVWVQEQLQNCRIRAQKLSEIFHHPHVSVIAGSEQSEVAAIRRWDRPHHIRRMILNYWLCLAV